MSDGKWNRAEIERRAIELAAEQAGVNVGEVLPAHHLREDLEFDSLDEVEYAMKIEDEFKLSIADERVQEIKRVEQAIECITKHLAAAGRLCDDEEVAAA